MKLEGRARTNPSALARERLLAAILACAATFAAEPPGVGVTYRYDFGSKSTSPAPGHVRVGIEDTYAKGGRGLIHSKGRHERGYRRRKVHPDPRLDAFVFDGGGLTFVQEVPNGMYRVTLASGDARYDGKASITINGRLVAPLVTTRDNEFVAVENFPVSVTDGQITIQIRGLGRLNFVEIVPASGRNVGGGAPETKAGKKAYTIWRFESRAKPRPKPPANLPKGEWEMGRDAHGAIVRVNLSAIRDWSRVPGIKKRWELRGPNGERRCFIGVASNIRDVDDAGRLDLFRLVINRPYAQLARFDYEGREIWRSRKLAPCAGDESGLPIHDLDGDGAFECVLSQKGKVYCIRVSDGTVRWEAAVEESAGRNGRAWDYPMMVGHFPADRTRLGVVVRAGLTVHCFGPDGSPLWTRKLGGELYGHEVDRHDVDADGHDEIFIGRNRNTTALSHDGRVLWEDGTQRNHTDFFGFGDIDGDGRCEAIYDHDGCGGRGPLYVVDAVTGKRKLAIDYRQHGLRHAQGLTCADFDPAEPGLEIAIDGKSRMLLLFDARGQLLWKRDTPTSLISKGDWNGDGIPDIFVFTIGVNVDPAWQVWDGQGRRLFAISWLPAPTRSHAIMGAPGLGVDGFRDLDGNGRADVLTGFGPWNFGEPQNLFLLEAPE